MSFRLKTILGIALIESVLLLVLVISSLSFLHESNEGQLIERATTTSRLFASATKDAVLATDLATLDAFVTEILGHSEVVYVRIRGDGKRVLAEGGDPALLADERQPDVSLETVDDGVYDTYQPIVESGIEFGRVELGLSTAGIQGVFSEATRWAAGIAITEVVLVAVFSLILGTYLTRELLQLRRASEAIVHSGPGHQVEVSGRDELADVANAFNAMSRSLEHTYSQLQQSLARSDDMLQQAERNRVKSQAILASSQDAIITIDKHGRVIDYNAAAERIFGWHRDEIAGQVMADFIVPHALREGHHRGMAHYQATGEGPVLNQRIQLPALHKDGHEFPVEITISDISTPDGPMFTAFLRDITQHIADQTELRLAATAFETSEPMFITDANATIIRINEAFSRVTGYEANEVIGNRPSMWASGRHDRAFYATMWQALKTTGKWSGEIYNRRWNGEVLPEYLSINAVYAEDGEVTHYVAHTIDISKQKARERQLKLASLHAKRADEAKGRFLAVMSHEIRTPMNAVLGMLELLDETELSSSQRRLVGTGRESGELLLSIINDILDVSKMEAGKLQLDCRVFDLHQTLSQSMELFRAQADRKKIALILDIRDELPRFVRGDRTRLRQVLVNLIGNAVKFTATGSVMLTATHEPDATALGARLVFSVQDTGVGIPRAQIGSLFQPFSMIDQSHTRRTDGTGLGLAISKRLAELMGGDIQVTSELGRGTCFRFHALLQVATPEEAEVPQPTGETFPLAQATRILLAEDNLANQQVFRAMLEPTGVHLDVVGNGHDAVEAVRARRYDVILMDISMPVLDGIGATRAIRNIMGMRSQTPIIALTAHSASSDRERFLAAGMDDHVSKPVQKPELLACIARWTERRAPLSSASPPLPAARPQPAARSTHAPATPANDERLAAGDVAESRHYVDEPALQRLVRDTSADVAPGLLRGYILDARERIALIGDAAALGDAEQLAFQAHTLGSSAAAHGNPEVHRLARDIESRCRAGDTDGALAQAADLITTTERSLDALSQRLSKGL